MALGEQFLILALLTNAMLIPMPMPIGLRQAPEQSLEVAAADIMARLLVFAPAVALGQLRSRDRAPDINARLSLRGMLPGP